MSLDGFLTFFGLVIAAYAVLDPTTRLKLRLNAPGQAVLFVFFVTAILTFQFILPILSILPEDVSVKLVGFGFGQPSDLMSNQKVSFILTLLWVVLSVFIFSLSRPSGRKLTRLLPLVNRLYDERRHLELIRIVAPYADQLRVYRCRTHPALRLHDWISRSGSVLYPLFGSDSNDNWRAPRWLRPAFRKFQKVLPKLRGRIFAANSIIDTIAKSPEIRSELQAHQVEFSVRFFRSFQGSVYNEFEKFIMESMQNSGSFLREDLRATVNTDGLTYAISPKCVTLLGFVGDVEFAQRSAVWRPVGEAALKAVREDKNYIDSLSDVPPFEDEDLHSDIVYSSIHFFDILITRAAIEGVSDNFWLMYVAIFAEKILAIHDPSRAPSHYEGEFPTLGVRNIWEAQHKIQGWVELAWRLPGENVHKSPRSADEAREVCAIPYWAAHSLCRTVRAIVLSPNVDESFKVERLSSFIRTASQAPKSGQSSYLREFLAVGLLVGPFDIPSRNISAELGGLLPKTDHVYRSRFPELAAAMKT